MGREEEDDRLGVKSFGVGIEDYEAVVLISV